MKQAANDATEAPSGPPSGLYFDLFGVGFTINPGQSRAALVDAEGCLIDAAMSVLKPGNLPVGETADSSQACTAYLILELLSAVNGAAQAAR